ncbi:MAG: Nif3-like dinuclear metal center hexameric protein [Chryseolinea sp.]
MHRDLKVKDITSFLESFAPRSYQESYDNSGLITGNPGTPVSGILVTLDSTEDVIDEAITAGCNLIIAHHPIVFKGLKKITGQHYVDRVIIKAIKNDIALYAIHTNLDNIHTGVNQRICEQIGLKNLRILAPRKDTLSKLVTFVPLENADAVLAAVHAAGAGQTGNYKDCSFRVQGTGSFLPNDTAEPYFGKRGEKQSVEEYRIEILYQTFLEAQILKALRESHPYEEVAYYITPLSNENQDVGAGMTGELAEPMEPLAFLAGLKKSMDLTVIRHTKLLEQPVKKIAVCGGSGSFLLPKAIESGAQVFITSDFKYHEFFDADGRIIIADIGHYESEAFTKDLLVDVLMKKFPTFAIIFSKFVTNPISYL